MNELMNVSKKCFGAGRHGFDTGRRWEKVNHMKVFESRLLSSSRHLSRRKKKLEMDIGGEFEVFWVGEGMGRNAGFFPLHLECMEL